MGIDNSMVIAMEGGWGEVEEGIRGKNGNKKYNKMKKNLLK